MLYVVYGIQQDKARAKKDALVASCRKQRPDAEFFVVDSDNFSGNTLESLCSSQGLFEKKHIVVLDRLLLPKKEREDGGETRDIVKDLLLDTLPKIAATESVFILYNEMLDAKTLTLLKKYAKDMFVFGEKKEAKEKDNTTFLITKAFAGKDKKGAWVHYQKAIKKGLAPEAIYGALFWQTKMILLAKKDGGWNEFSKNFSENELDEILTRINKMYHRIRSDGGELEIELEKFLLKG